MEIIFSIIALVAIVSLYDYFAARRWQQVTSVERNNIVFAHRNREYGAFVIRRDYDKRLLIIMIALIGTIGLAYGAYKVVQSIPEEIEEEKPMDMSQFTIAAPPPEDLPPPPPEEPIPPMEKSVAFLPPVVSDEEQTDPPPIQEDMDDKKSSTLDNDTDNESFTAPQTPKVEIIEKAKEPEIALDVEEYAEFPGGKKAMMEFLNKNIKYPQLAIEQGIQGRCFLRFVVSTEGKISDVRVLRGVPDCPECDKEAIRVVKSMPRWKPGKNNGRGVNSYFDMPVSFTLE